MVDVRGSGTVGGTNQSATNNFGEFAFWFEWIELPGGTPVSNLAGAGFETAGGTLTGNLGPGQTVFNAGGSDVINLPAQSGTFGNDGDLFAVRVSTTLTVETGGIYTFNLGSDDGSRLFVDGVEVVENDGLHAFRTESDTINLGPGTHEIEVIFFENGGQANLDVSIAGPDYAGTVSLNDANVQANAANDTVVAAEGDDVVQGGAGDDSIDGGAGNDSIDGGEGNDTIDAGAGNDTVKGEGPLGDVTLSRESFNWSEIPDPDDGSAIDDEDELTDSVIQNTGSVRVSVEFTPEERSDGFFFNNSDTQNVAGIIGGGEPVSTTSSARLDGISGGTPGDTSTVALNFEGADADTLDEVRNVQFRINDIDDSSWRDIVQIRAFDADGNGIPVNLSLGAGGRIVLSDTDGVPGNDTATAIDGSNNGSPSTPANSLLVSIPGPVSRIEVDYGNLQTGGQRIDITDVFFDAVSANGTFDDSITGGEGNDSLLGELGSDEVFGGIGDDTIDGGVGDDTLDGGEGTDSIIGGFGNDSIAAGAGNDSVDGGVGNDSIVGGTGNDSLIGGDGNDTIEGGDDNDNIDGSTGDDSLNGDDGSDTITGGEGNDTLNGGEGADSLDGGAGNDQIDGGIGSDEIVASTGTDNIEGGEGTDTYTVPGSSTFADDTLTITVTVDENGDGTVVKSLGNTTDTIGSVESFVADEAAAENDRLVYTTTVTDEGTISGLDDATGIFVNSKTGAFTFFGGAGQPTFNDVLDLDVTGSFFANGADLTGTVGNIAFQDFETVEFNVICFAGGTMIDTPYGQRSVESLKPGDLVMTADNGAQPVRWIGSRAFGAATLAGQPHLRPITIRAGALGNDRDLSVSPQHRMLVKGQRAELMFGTPEVLVKAKDLMHRDDVVVSDMAEVEYFHILFDSHEIVFANGAPAESLHPGAEAIDTLSADSRGEVLSIFPELADLDRPRRALARYALRSYEARALGH